jgi:phosphoribosylamine--glycine ligase
MRVLVIGSGGREHALVSKLAEHHEVTCAPGNPGMARDVEVIPIPVTDLAALGQLATSGGFDLVVIGPEDPLVAGLSDQIRVCGVCVYGPSMAAARLEGSKAFSKRLMAEAAIPTAGFKVFTEVDPATDHAREVYGAGGQLAVKVSGNALGRGVAVCQNLEAALEAIQSAMVERKFGSAGEILVLEEMMVGREFSLLTIVGSHNYVSLPIAQDYKRALDGDEGPNTGGMGSFSPCDWAADDLIHEVECRMVEPILAKLAATGATFSGTLFTGVMVTESGPKCLEYNVRFGDPETQSIMMRLEGDFGQTLLQSAKGEWIDPPAVSIRAAVTVVIASSGYPGRYLKGAPITIGAVPPAAKLFFAGVSEQGGQLVNSGGRVIAATGTGSNIDDARAVAYEAAKAVSFEGAYFRKDIAV